MSEIKYIDSQIKKAEDQIEQIVKRLKEDAGIIALVGQAGVGKTWIAKKVQERVIQDASAHRVIWLSLNMKHDTMSLLEDVARQLSLLSTTEEWEDDLGNDEQEEEKKLKKDSLKDLQEKISKKGKAMRIAMLPKPEEKISVSQKYLLLILDDVQSKKIEGEKAAPKPNNRGKKGAEEVISELDELLGLKEHNLLKVLITRRDTAGPTTIPSEVVIEIAPLNDEDQLAVLKEAISPEVFTEEDLQKVLNKTSKNPARIVVAGKALKHIAITKDQKALEEVMSDANSADGPTWLMQCAYDMLPGETMEMSNCVWFTREFFRDHGGLRCNELIVNWILEGCLGPIENMDKMYERGHRILMELIDRGMMKVQEDNVVIMEESVQTVPDCRLSRFGGPPLLGLTAFYEDASWRGLGRVTPAGDMIKTPAGPKRWEKVSTLLIEGNRLRREVYEKFFSPMNGLENLAIFGPTFNELPGEFSKMEKLRLLVLRDCHRLENINCIKKLQSLTILEISSSRSFKIVPDFIFEGLTNLRTLNLSETGIESLPPTISNLVELCWLVLRGCTELKSLPTLKENKKLEGIDLSRATLLSKIKSKNIRELSNLQMVDVSQTLIKRFPILKDLEKLTHLSLRGCKNLTRLPQLKLLSNLHVLDLSDTTSLKEIHDESCQNKKGLKVLILSGAAISRLPSSFTHLSNLERFEFSKAFLLVEMEESTFENMKYLRHLNLSEFPLDKLPSSLSDLVNLRDLILNDCKKLKNLPNLNAMKKLEILELSGCSSLTIKDDKKSFDVLSRLRILNLSDTKIKKMPSLTNLENLSQLVLRNCNLRGSGIDVEHMNQLEVLDLSGTESAIPSFSKLTKLKELSLRCCSIPEEGVDLGNLLNLEVLDLSKTLIKSLPSSIEKLIKLRKILLRECEKLARLVNLEPLDQLEFLDLCGTKIKEFPDWMTKLTCLHIDLPNLEEIVKDGEMIQRLPGKIDFDHHVVFKNTTNRPSVTISGTGFSQILKKDSEFWNECLKKFYVSICPLKDQGKDDVEIYCQQEENSFKHVYLSSISGQEGGLFIEICEFDEFPDGFEDVLEKVEYVAFTENSFSGKSLSDLVKVNTLKGCWFRKCTEVNSIFDGEKEEDRLRENLEILWVSNLLKLESIWKGSKQSGSFARLRHLCLDCCPLIETVFSPNFLPGELEVVQVKFCDKLKSLFEGGEKGKGELMKLKKLELMELPELMSIGLQFPSLLVKNIVNCPKLKEENPMQSEASDKVSSTNPQ